MTIKLIIEFDYIAWTGFGEIKNVHGAFYPLLNPLPIHAKELNILALCIILWSTRISKISLGSFLSPRWQQCRYWTYLNIDLPPLRCFPSYIRFWEGSCIYSSLKAGWISWRHPDTNDFQALDSDMTVGTNCIVPDSAFRSALLRYNWLLDICGTRRHWLASVSSLVQGGKHNEAVLRLSLTFSHYLHAWCRYDSAVPEQLTCAPRRLAAPYDQIRR